MRRLLLGNFLSALCATAVMAQQTIIHAGALFDGLQEELQTNITITIEDGIIQSIENGFTEPASDEDFIDLSDKTVLPGLIDLHVHLEGETNPNRQVEGFTLNPEVVAFRSAVHSKSTLMAGFTTVRDLG